MSNIIDFNSTRLGSGYTEELQKLSLLIEDMCTTFEIETQDCIRDLNYLVIAKDIAKYL